MPFRIKNKTGFAITVILADKNVLSLIPKEVTAVLPDNQKSESMKYQEKKDDIAFLSGDYKTPDEKSVEKFDTVKNKKPLGTKTPKESKVDTEK